MRQKPSTFTILLWVALAGCCIGVFLLAPRTMDAYNSLNREQNATPTPTAITARLTAVCRRCARAMVGGFMRDLRRRGGCSMLLYE